MKLSFPSALVAGVLACGCSGPRVAQPPPPPAFQPPAAKSTEKSPGTAEAKVDTQAQAPAKAEPQAAQSAEQKTPPQAAAAEPAPGKAESSTPRPPKTEAPPLGWIAGQPLLAEELLLEWGDAASRELWMIIDKIVAARLALSEAGRLGIKLAPEAVELRFSAEREKLQKEMARGGKELTLEQFIERELGFEPGRYLDRVRRATIRQMLAERAVRAASLAAESVALRLIVVANDEQKQKVTAALAEGRDFAEVARELSADDSKKNGGLVPFIAREERSPLARLAFQTAVGEVAGPLPIGDHHFWIRIEERRTPVEGDWGKVEAPVEASLASIPVGDAEFVHWKLSMEGRYPIDLGPLWSLIGAAK